MSRMVGADVEELRALAAQFSSSASRLRHVAQSIRTGVHGSPWRGSIADMFRVSWDNDHSARLRAAADRLDEAARTLSINAAEQQQASASLEGGAGSSVGASLRAMPTGWSDNTSGWDWGTFGRDVLEGEGLFADIVGFAQEHGPNTKWVEKQLPTLGRYFKGAGKGLPFVGLGFGLFDSVTASHEGDGFGLADGIVSTGLGLLGTAAVLGAVTNPVGLGVVAALGIGWGVASLASGDVPVMKHVWDGGSSLVRGSADAAQHALEGATKVASDTAKAVSRGAENVVNSVLAGPKKLFGW